MELHKIFLFLAVSLFLFSFTLFGGAIGWGIIRPLSSVAFILFFILNVFKGEAAKFDEEQPYLTACAKGRQLPSAANCEKAPAPGILQQTGPATARRAA
jgi:hypothetical protein